MDNPIASLLLLHSCSQLLAFHTMHSQHQQAWVQCFGTACKLQIVLAVHASD